MEFLESIDNSIREFLIDVEIVNAIGYTICRQEAVDMLCDLAVRKLSPGTSSGSSCKQSSGTSCNSPRRLRRLATRTPTADEGIVVFLKERKGFRASKILVRKIFIIN